MIPAYTLAAFAALALSLTLNVRFNPFFKNRSLVLVTLGTAAASQLVFDNLTVSAGFWHFSQSAIMGIRIPFMPMENLLFGLALFLTSILVWERSQAGVPSTMR